MKVGFRTIDSALLYRSHDAVGKAIKRSGINREEISITTKVGYFPPNSEGKIFPWLDDNIKGNDAAAID